MKKRYGKNYEKTVPGKPCKNGASKVRPESECTDFGRFEGFCKRILKGKLGAVSLWKSGHPAIPRGKLTGPRKLFKEKGPGWVKKHENTIRKSNGASPAQLACPCLAGLALCVAGCVAHLAPMRALCCPWVVAEHLDLAQKPPIRTWKLQETTVFLKCWAQIWSQKDQ